MQAHLFDSLAKALGRTGTQTRGCADAWQCCRRAILGDAATSHAQFDDCPSGTSECSGSACDTSSDPANCGSCDGNSCRDDLLCDRTCICTPLFAVLLLPSLEVRQRSGHFGFKMCRYLLRPGSLRLLLHPAEGASRAGGNLRPGHPGTCRAHPGTSAGSCHLDQGTRQRCWASARWWTLRSFVPNPSSRLARGLGTRHRLPRARTDRRRSGRGRAL